MQFRELNKQLENVTSIWILKSPTNIFFDINLTFFMSYRNCLLAALILSYTFVHGHSFVTK